MDIAAQYNTSDHKILRLKTDIDRTLRVLRVSKSHVLLEFKT